MKTLTLIFLLAFCVIKFPAQAQIRQGDIMIGGNLANLNLGLNDAKNFSFDISPKAALFFIDNLAVGLYLNLGIETAKDAGTATKYGAGLLLRRYANSNIEILSHGRLFGEATLGVGGMNVTKGGGNTNGLDFSVGPGFAYFISPNLGLETLLKYNGLAGFGNEGYRSNINLSFGFQIYLPRKATDRVK